VTLLRARRGGPGGSGGAAAPPEHGGERLLPALLALAGNAALLLAARLAPGAAPGRLAAPPAQAFLALWLAWSAAEAALSPLDAVGRGRSDLADRLLGLATGAALLAGAWHGLWAPPRLVLSPPGALAAAGVVAAGAALRLWAVWTLGARFVSAARTAPGAPLATTGPYARLRHPSEVGLLALALGAAALLGSPVFLGLWAAALLPLSLARARREDRVLAAAHGEAFELYRRRTGGFLPRC
jgi:protein-S-isoprenylcysteine O-methyltransferase Ste14